MSVTVNAGQLDRRVAFDAATVTRGASGEERVAWTELFTVWGAVLPVTGREKLNGAQVLADMDTRIRIRYSSQSAVLTPKHRARVGSTVYNIVSVVNLQSAGVMLELLCHSGTNQG